MKSGLQMSALSPGGSNQNVSSRRCSLKTLSEIVLLAASPHTKHLPKKPSQWLQLWTDSASCDVCRKHKMHTHAHPTQHNCVKHMVTMHAYIHHAFTHIMQHTQTHTAHTTQTYRIHSHNTYLYTPHVYKHNISTYTYLHAHIHTLHHTNMRNTQS